MDIEKKAEKPTPTPGSYNNKNMLYKVHPSSIALSKKQEFILCEWIEEKFRMNKPVTRLIVRKKAKKILGNKYFQATEGWIKRFLFRHPEMKDYLISYSEKPQMHSDHSDSSRGWVGIEDNQLSREEFVKFIKE